MCKFDIFMLSYTGIDIDNSNLGLVSSAKNNWNFRLLKPEVFFFLLDKCLCRVVK